MIEIKTKSTTDKCYEVACFILCLFIFSCTEKPQKIVEKPQVIVESPQQIIARVKESVVTIKTPSGTGSGFIVSPDGFIFTNSHVVGNNETVEIHFPNGGTAIASVIKKGPSVLDIAVLKVDGSNYPYLWMETDCRAGDEVYAIGAPIGLSGSVSKGIISNCDRMLKGVNFIQTDVAVNAGNSGGPLINNQGDVVGLITFKISAEGVEGLNFALSSVVALDYDENKLTNLVEALKKEVIAQNPPHWIIVGDNDKFTTAYDVNSINFINKNVFEVWVVLKRKTPQPIGKRFYNETMDLLRYDCTEKSFVSLQHKMVYTDGETTNDTSPANKHYTDPSSVAGLIINQVCPKGPNSDRDEKSYSGEAFRQKSYANENEINEYNWKEKQRIEDERKEKLREEYCRKGEALRNKIELYKKDVQASRYIAGRSVSDIGYDENLSRYKDTLVRLKGAEMELSALEDDLHRKSLPIGWSRCQ